MTRNGKKWLVIGLAVIIGCMIPVGTMKASEQDVQAVDMPMQTAVSKVIFSYQQGNTTNDLTGTFGSIVSSDVYIGTNGSHALTVELGDSISSGYYCLLKDTTSVTQQELESRSDWKEIQGAQISLEGMPDGKYVACIKVIQSEETIYAVSKGFMLDTTVPKIIDESGKELESGKTYAADTKFTVSDLSPVDVYMNDNRTTPVQPVNGQYVVVPRVNSTSCTIIAIDKAGNEKSLSLTIEGGSTTPKPEEPVNNTITEPKTYTLQEGTAYTLGAGSWKVVGDSSVYPGGITFYVPAGNYTFQKQ